MTDSVWPNGSTLFSLTGGEFRSPVRRKMKRFTRARDMINRSKAFTNLYANLGTFNARKSRESF